MIDASLEGLHYDPIILTATGWIAGLRSG